MDVLAILALIASIYVAGRIAERRGRSFKNWAWIAALIGPFALPLVFLFPKLAPRERRPRVSAARVKGVETLPGDWLPSTASPQST